MVRVIGGDLTHATTAMLRTRESPPRGVEPDLFNVLLSDIDLAPVEDRIKPILHYARKLTSSPARMTEAMRLPSMKLGGETTHSIRQCW